jgi:hypothetical protein
MKRTGIFQYLVLLLCMLLPYLASTGILALAFSYISDDAVTFESVKWKFIFINVFLIGSVLYLIYWVLSILGFALIVAVVFIALVYLCKQIGRFKDGTLYNCFFADVEKLQRSINARQFLVLILGIITTFGLVLFVSMENLTQPLFATFGCIYLGLNNLQDE